MIEDEVCVGHEVACDGHIIDAPSQRERVHEEELHKAGAGYVELGILGTKHNVEIMRPEVVTYPSEDKYPKITLDPVPAECQPARAQSMTVCDVCGDSPL